MVTALNYYEAWSRVTKLLTMEVNRESNKQQELVFVYIMIYSKFVSIYKLVA